jgi:hypothetical protein
MDVDCACATFIVNGDWSEGNHHRLWGSSVWPQSFVQQHIVQIPDIQSKVTPAVVIASPIKLEPEAACLASLGAYYAAGNPLTLALVTNLSSTSWVIVTTQGESDQVQINAT